MDKNVILTAKDLSKTFSNASQQQHVLKNLNLDIYRGDFTVIMGNSGSGKSTLLYALSGMDRPSLGTITYKGTGAETEISKFTNDQLAKFRRNHCGFVFQQNYLNDSMSALDNVMVSGLLLTTDRKALAARAQSLLEKVEIGKDDWNKFPAQMSGSRLTIAILSLFGIEKIPFHIPAGYMVFTGVAILAVALATAGLLGLRVRRINPVEMITEE